MTAMVKTREKIVKNSFGAAMRVRAERWTDFLDDDVSSLARQRDTPQSNHLAKKHSE
jgi:hypothetical protein